MLDPRREARGESYYPYTLLWHGVVEARGLFFPGDTLDEAQIAARVLSAWQHGARLQRHALGVALIWPQPRRLDCAASAGWPLCQSGAGLSTLPLRRAEARRIPAGAMVLAWGGALRTLAAGEFTPLQAAHWIDLGTVTVAHPLPGQPAFDAPTVLPQAQARPLHELLHGVPPPNEQLVMPDELNLLARAARSAATAFGKRVGSAARTLHRLVRLPRHQWVVLALGLLILVGMVAWFVHLGGATDPLPGPVRHARPGAGEPAVESGGTNSNNSNDIALWVLGGLLAVIFCLLLPWLWRGLLWLLAGLRSALGRFAGQRAQAVHPRRTQSARASPRAGLSLPAPVVVVLVIGGVVLVLNGIGGLLVPALVIGALSRLVRSAGSSNGAGAASGATPGGAPGRASAGAGWWGRLAQWLGRGKRGADGADEESQWTSNWFNRMLLNSRLGQLFERQHARYFARMLAMFERGDMEEALRHAIPLGNDLPGQIEPSLLPHSPRRDLAIRMQKMRSGGTFMTGDSFHHFLEQTYRRAFERLDREGQVDRAAFVLAELLFNIEEAAAYLEKHGRLHQAAEFAEARGRDPAQAVRLWIKAGDVARAYQLALRRDAYAPAIRLLEAEGAADPRALAAAQHLRVTYAARLAESGDYLSAVTYVWPVPRARGLGAQWVQTGLASDSGQVPGLLAHAAQFLHEHPELWRPAWDVLIDPEADPARRVACAAALNTVEATPLARGLMRELLRQIACDHAQQPGLPQPNGWSNWISYTADAALREDCPAPRGQHPAQAAVRRMDGGAPRNITAPRQARVYDAASAAGGGVALAQGELGATLIRQRGGLWKRVRQFQGLTHRLVMSSNGLRAIALAHLGDLWEVRVLELDTGRVRAYGRLRLDWFADEWDGMHWFCADGGRVLRLNMLADRPQVTWQLAEGLPGPLAAAACREGLLSLLFRYEHEDYSTFSNHAFELWKYAPKVARLSSRNEAFYPVHPRQPALAWTENSVHFVAAVAGSEQGGAALRRLQPVYHRDAPAEGQVLLAWRADVQRLLRYEIAGIDQWLAFAGYSAAHLLLLSQQQSLMTVRAEYRFEGAAECQFRVGAPDGEAGAGVLAWDDTGRLVRIDPASTDVTEEIFIAD